MIKSLDLFQFRRYAKAKFFFKKGINYIYGKNAVGKTTILEAICALSLGRPFRTKNFQELILKEKNTSHIELHFTKSEVPQKISLSLQGKKKCFSYNETSLSSTSELLGIIPALFLLPEDPRLIKGDPAHRRLCMDIVLIQAHPIYLYHLTRFSQALAHRNALLKKQKLTSLAIFEQQLAHHGAEIFAIRARWAEKINSPLSSIHSDLSGHKESLEIQYQAQIPYDGDLFKTEKLYAEKLLQERAKALHLGYTSLGPHRDDFKIVLNKKDTKHYASEGQIRLSVLSLQLAQWSHLYQESRSLTLLCIDDVAVSLDKERQKALFDYLENKGPEQILLTSCLPPEGLNNPHLISIESID